ncbi:acyl-CoA carboxylase subunit beta [Frankia nepalensis]|uniref:Acyl-CoA carboxylase subunit beta n=1 Tax=Frankia nepalensis TaxID=1836974 RepID=A0A937UWC8_9ACTN|nr:carboxyl transferase domain-containing protein [Frankia nepalensis]MBL7497597.1 acyl-CoA carboxylase subunit beta [Frankia nepalensis]MBL7511783.1 acyl-CoA carboxylase subunit beta [Frankia nepalensis]MBL7633271.1 acyl-CoA carboxylase subunit beta [Frankia nepalensis]
MTDLDSGIAATVTIPAQDPRDPRRRLSLLFDPGSFQPFPAPAGSRVLTGRGRVEGVPAIAYCTDGSRMGGALGGSGARHIAAAIDRAVREGAPVIGLWHSGGAALADGVEALDGIGEIFAANVRASGRVPQVSVVLGPAAGGAAYGPALTDVIILAPAGRVFVTGPDVVRSVTGEQVDMEGLGGPDAHGSRSGVVHVVATSEADALARARRITTLLAAPGRFDLTGPDARAADPSPRLLLPDRPRRAYDVRPLVRALLDESSARPGQAGAGHAVPVQHPRRDGPAPGAFEEIQPRWAANVVVGFGRLRGASVGVVANNPLRKGGCLDSLSAEKAARFVRLCDSFGVPLVVLVDVPGYLPGVRQEWEGVVRRGAKLLYAFAEATVPRVTLVTRKSFGGAYIAMNSRSLGATRVLAWPEAEVAVMGAEAAVGILRRRALAAASDEDRPGLLSQLAEEHARTAGGIERGVELGVIDAIIDPADTRGLLAEALAGAPARRGDHGNIPL